MIHISDRYSYLHQNEKEQLAENDNNYFNSFSFKTAKKITEKYPLLEYSKSLGIDIEVNPTKKNRSWIKKFAIATVLFINMNVPEQFDMAMIDQFMSKHSLKQAIQFEKFKEVMKTITNENLKKIGDIFIKQVVLSDDANYKIVDPNTITRSNHKTLKMITLTDAPDGMEVKLAKIMDEIKKESIKNNNTIDRIVLFYNHELSHNLFEKCNEQCKTFCQSTSQINLFQPLSFDYFAHEIYGNFENKIDANFDETVILKLLTHLYQ